MTSFVNLLGSDVWSDADIKSRLHAEIRSVVSELAETELNRALQGMAMGMHVLSPAEQASLMLFKATTDSVALAGIEARADMALLQSVFEYEAAQARLLQEPVLTPATITVTDVEGAETTVANPAVVIDAAERITAQAGIDAASVETLDLVLLRNPPPEPEPEPLP